MTKHPDTRFARMVEEEKHRFVNDKTKKERRDGRVWRKLAKEQVKYREAEEELRNGTSYLDDLSRGNR